jgi:hypothetical protein
MAREIGSCARSNIDGHQQLEVLSGHSCAIENMQLLPLYCYRSKICSYLAELAGMEAKVACIIVKGI